MLVQGDLNVHVDQPLQLVLRTMQRAHCIGNLLPELQLQCPKHHNRLNSIQAIIVLGRSLQARLAMTEGQVQPCQLK